MLRVMIRYTARVHKFLAPIKNQGKRKGIARIPVSAGCASPTAALRSLSRATYTKCLDPRHASCHVNFGAQEFAGSGGTQCLGTGNGISGDPHVLELAVDLNEHGRLA